MSAQAPVEMHADAGVILFVTSEVMFFGPLFGAYLTLRSRAETWPPPRTPEMSLWLRLALTIVLVSSSVTQRFGWAW